MLQNQCCLCTFGSSHTALVIYTCYYSLASALHIWAIWLQMAQKVCRCIREYLRMNLQFFPLKLGHLYLHVLSAQILVLENNSGIIFLAFIFAHSLPMFSRLSPLFAERELREDIGSFAQFFANRPVLL